MKKISIIFGEKMMDGEGLPIINTVRSTDGVIIDWLYDNGQVRCWSTCPDCHGSGLPGDWKQIQHPIDAHGIAIPCSKGV